VVVEAREVTFRWPGGGVGVDGVGLRVGPGERVAVLGPNGSGKSTLLRLLATELAATSGTVTWFGSPDPPRGSTLPALRRRVAFAPDAPAFAGALTGREHLRLFRALRGHAGPGADPWLATFGLSDAADRPVDAYSFGMKRRLVLAEAFGSSAGLVVLDEPTVGLDPSGRRVFMEGVAKAGGEGVAVILATHDLREVAPRCDRVVFLHRGRVVADASPEALLGRVRGRTRILVDVATGSGAPAAGMEDPVPGVDLAARLPEGTLEFRTRAEAPPLAQVVPALLSRLLEEGLAVTDLRIREAGLDVVFEEMTGVTIGEPAGREGPGGLRFRGSDEGP
jgi:ABC-type multidrug transport system ATPase subunit